jgi:shikimate kinase
VKRPPLADRTERFYLVGFSGSGKSTIGPILANTLGYAFVDLDLEIEKASGRIIADIFASEGERAFREMERSALRGLAGRSRLVVSFGGGALTWEATAALAFDTGVVVYLEASHDEIVNRLKKKTDRPLLLGDDGKPLDPAALRERIGRLYDAREASYRQADIIVPTDRESLGLTIDRLSTRLSRLLKIRPGA